MLAAAGYDAGREMILAVKDSDGLGTILPADFDAFDVGRDVVAGLRLKEKIETFRRFAVETKKNGTIAVNSKN